uniref:ETS-related transcription factor Elf-5-like protein n=1 Tax=Callorhinchus milii TaxID=7868 RepID=V9KUB4_CALMI|eukprot:gi/632941373/ref/XP_007885831.1/ PREDICTED: ETS-related transcription factor Elf-5 [Callorhinchus milii]
MLDSYDYSSCGPGLILYSPLSWPMLYEQLDWPNPEDYGVSNPSWTSILPEEWSNRHVWEWLQFCCDQHKLDANCIPFAQFNVNGRQLCSMTQSQFISAAGIYGEILYNSLHQSQSKADLPLVCDPVDKELHIDERTLNLEQNAGCFEGSQEQSIPAKKQAGLQSHHLWEFIRDLLLSPEENNDVLEWVDRNEGIFKVLKSDSLAKLWGRRKKNERMTYEKLSRALRHYYKTGILDRVDKRLVYKFGRNAYGWR